MLDDKKGEAQQALDELFSEHLLPFKLSARRVESIGLEEYIVRFHGSRLRSIDVSWVQGEVFKDVFRAAVLQRLGRLHREPAAAA
jgi:hypothetical protein